MKHSSSLLSLLSPLGGDNCFFSKVWATCNANLRRIIFEAFNRAQRIGALSKHLDFARYLESSFRDYFLATRTAEIKARLKRSTPGIPPNYEDPESCSYNEHLEHQSKAFLQARLDLQALAKSSVDRHAETYGNFAILFLEQLRNMAAIMVQPASPLVIVPADGTVSMKFDVILDASSGHHSRAKLICLHQAIRPVFASAKPSSSPDNYEDAALYD
jgi:hypothetical protein